MMKKPNIMVPMVGFVGIALGLFAHIEAHDKLSGWILAALLFALVALEYFMGLREYYYREYVESKQQLKNTEENDADSSFDNPKK